MGAVKVMLSEKQLKSREKHNSRLFVDLCENIHIHFREYRFVFSLPEFYEFVDVVNKSTLDVNSYLAQNPDYQEGIYSTTLMVAGGQARQLKFLQNSPAPNESAYFNDSLRIELQEEYVTDEIHVHYRDFRLCLNRENFRDIAESFSDALLVLNEFESENSYVRLNHDDREIGSWTQPKDITDSDTPTMGLRSIPIPEVKSKWHKDILTDWNPDKKAIDCLIEAYRSGQPWSPVIVVRDDLSYVLVDGHHRVRAALEMGLDKIDAIVLEDIDWENTSLIREAEVKLKEFDKLSGYKYNLSSFFQRYVAENLNSYYRDHFHNLISKPSLPYRLLQKSKQVVLLFPMPNVLREAITNISGSKRFWR